MNAAGPHTPGMAHTARSGRVDGTEAGSGQREEDSRSLGNGCRNALAALEAGPDQMAGISSIDVGTGGAAHRAPGATGLEDDTIGQ